MDTQQTLTTAAIAASFMGSPAAIADHADLRTFVDAADQAERIVPRPASIMRSIQAILTPGDRNAPQAMRPRGRETSIGPFDFSLSAMHVKGGSIAPPHFATSPNYGTRSAALRVSLDIGSEFELRSELLLAHMKHHLMTLVSGYHARSTNFGMLGLGIARRDGPALTFDYLRVRGSGGRAPLERMVEIAEGAPRAGSGMRLTYSAMPGAVAFKEAQWGVTLSAWRHPATEFGVPGSRAAADNRAELFFRLPL